MRQLDITENQINDRNTFIQIVKNYQGFKQIGTQVEPLTEEREKALIVRLKRYWQDIKGEGEQDLCIEIGLVIDH